MDEPIEFVDHPAGGGALPDPIDGLFDLFVDFDALVLDPQLLPSAVTANNTDSIVSPAKVPQLPEEGPPIPAPPTSNNDPPASLNAESQFNGENNHGGEPVALEVHSLPDEHETIRCRRFAFPSFQLHTHDFRTRAPNKGPQRLGNNLHGRRGTKRCKQCRKWRLKVRPIGDFWLIFSAFTKLSMNLVLCATAKDSPAGEMTRFGARDDVLSKLQTIKNQCPRRELSSPQFPILPPFPTTWSALPTMLSPSIGLFGALLKTIQESGFTLIGPSSLTPTTMLVPSWCITLYWRPRTSSPLRFNGAPVSANVVRLFPYPNSNNI
jgi:hypothetical protein